MSPVEWIVLEPGQSPRPLLRWRVSQDLRLHLVPVLPIDVDRLEAGSQLLSVRSLYTRFFTGMQSPSRSLLERLVDTDQDQHIAWGALDPNRPDLPGIGIGHLVRMAGDPGSAEVAVTVIDSYQGRGVGAVLLALLYALASRNDIDQLVGSLMATNQAFVPALRLVGAEVRDLGREYSFKLPVWPTTPPHLRDNKYARLFFYMVRKLRQRLPDWPPRPPGDERPLGDWGLS
ncbi:MAG: hypothetical protein D6722_04505 [Bacteroidetes bacterium]|nr:MAG: hypothetical protein D6722_04505 [Bacteroidota bacterium]